MQRKSFLNYKVRSREKIFRVNGRTTFILLPMALLKPVKVSLRYGQSKLAVYSYAIQYCPACPGVHRGTLVVLGLPRFAWLPAAPVPVWLHSQCNAYLCDAKGRIFVAELTGTSNVWRYTSDSVFREISPMPVNR